MHVVVVAVLVVLVVVAVGGVVVRPSVRPSAPHSGNRAGGRPALLTPCRRRCGGQCLSGTGRGRDCVIPVPAIPVHATPVCYFHGRVRLKPA